MHPAASAAITAAAAAIFIHFFAFLLLGKPNFFFGSVSDVLSSMKEIPVITGYTLDGKEVPRFDPLSDLDRVKPVVTLLPGWNKDISGCTSWDELPGEAKGYVQFLEKQLNHEIQFVSTGAEREKFVLKGAWL